LIPTPAAGLKITVAAVEAALEEKMKSNQARPRPGGKWPGRLALAAALALAVWTSPARAETLYAACRGEFLIEAANRWRQEEACQIDNSAFDGRPAFVRRVELTVSNRADSRGEISFWLTRFGFYDGWGGSFYPINCRFYRVRPGQTITASFEGCFLSLVRLWDQVDFVLSASPGQAEPDPWAAGQYSLRIFIGSYSGF